MSDFLLDIKLKGNNLWRNETVGFSECDKTQPQLTNS